MNHKNLYVISTEDVQDAAQELVGRILTESEMSEVKKHIEQGFEYIWRDVIDQAIDNVIFKKKHKGRRKSLAD